ncbi:MAG: DEAD/DEAH box helicase [Halobacteriota archaeon]
MLSVADSINGQFASLFPFSYFNQMQSHVLPRLLTSDENVVVAAPTASGKTVLAELAMVRELSKTKRGKILYLAPLRALTNEKESEWKTLFTPMGFEVYVVSGERELDPSKARSAQIIISTPEKWDSSSRKHSTTHKFVNDVSVIIIDEVHLLDSDERGGVLEALVTRMKRIRRDKVRIVALSATMPNVGEVAQWIGAPDDYTFTFDDTFRPVPLNADVFRYNPGKNKFVDKYIRLYKAVQLIERHIPDGQALIFVATRSDTVQAATKLVEIFEKKSTKLASNESEQIAKQIKNKSLSEAVRNGVGFHHAGLVKQDRDIVEGAFKGGHIKILVSTSTLAWGVNLPARVVVIRDIANEVIDEDLSSLDILQMIGRAGRPQYDERGFGWIIAPRDRAEEFIEMLREGPPIRSQLNKTLSEHLNAEISMGTINSRAEAKKWLSETFYFVQNPQSSVLLDDHINSLIKQGFAGEADGLLLPTDLGKLASKYYLRLNTAREFAQLREGPTDEELLDAVASAEEFADVVVRRNEVSAIKRTQSSYQGHKSKVRSILDTYIGRGEIAEALKSDAWLIRQNALRLLSALEAFIERFNAPETVLRTRILALRLEYGASEELSSLLQLDGIGIKQATQLHAQGVRSPSDLTPAILSRLVFGARIAESIDRLPKITIDMKLPDSIPFGQSAMCYATISNAQGGARLTVTVFANGLKMFRDSFYLAKGYSKSIPIGVYGSGNVQVCYQARIDFLNCIEPPMTREKTIIVTELPDNLPQTDEYARIGALTNSNERPQLKKAKPATSSEVSHKEIAERFQQNLLHTLPRESTQSNGAQSSDESILEEPKGSVGRCKKCGGLLKRAGNVITCECGAFYKLPSGADLADSSCSCGLPKLKLQLLGEDVCIDRQCERIEDVIARHFATSNFVCPRCHSSLIVVRRKGIIVGCTEYYNGCKTAFLLPMNAKVIGSCKCGLPTLQLKTKIRCLDTKCRVEHKT